MYTASVPPRSKRARNYPDTAESGDAYDVEGWMYDPPEPPALEA